MAINFKKGFRERLGSRGEVSGIGLSRARISARARERILKAGYVYVYVHGLGIGFTDYRSLITRFFLTPDTGILKAGFGLGIGRGLGSANYGLVLPSEPENW